MVDEFQEWGCRVEEEEGEPRVLLDVPRRTQEEMKEIVLGLLNGSLLPSVFVPDNLKGMVFLPMAMGGLSPPKEVVERVMGSASPPETVEGDPPKPPYPAYPDRNPDPPDKPTRRLPDPALKAALEWEDIEPEEWEAHLVEVEEENNLRIMQWQDAHNEWMDLCDSISEKCRQLDEAYAKEIAAWQEELKAHQDRDAERKLAYDTWVERHARIFSRWGEDVGCLLGDMKNTFPRAINGFPMFHAFSIVHREDWHRIDAAAQRESERQSKIEV